METLRILRGTAGETQSTGQPYEWARPKEAADKIYHDVETI
jgi:hypothetical protein